MIARIEGTDCIVADKTRVADTFLSRFRGLMFRLNLDEGEALHITPCQGGVHMFFMFFPIDVLFLDTEGVILKIVHRLKPFAVSFGAKGAYSVLELKSGTAEKLELEAGRRILFEEGESNG